MTRIRNRATRAVVTTAAVGVTTIAMVGGSAPAVAAVAHPTAHTDSVSVSGHGSAKGTPDTLVIDFDAHATQSTAKAALDTAGSAATAVIDALEAQGVAASRIQTFGLSVEPHYSHGHRNGFQADESMTAKIPLADAGDALDAAASAGGNHLRIDDARLTIAHKAKLIEKARADAFASAKDAAEQFATLAGRQLGRVMSITANVHGTNGERLAIHGAAGAVAAAPGSPIPLNPGRQTVSASVRVVWAMRH
ncbi:MAG TPA: SIMPL domain-containing protein [Mycobacteriales bacterium]|jgi:uncharacterized protein YggE|nr:SIMPL domain-containing protein [Mycobacteriales bacterium]